MKKLTSSFILSLLTLIIHAQYTDQPLLDVNALNSEEIWVVGSLGTILYTSDGGLNWDDYSNSNYHNLRSICFTDDQCGFIVGDSGLVLRTNDGGQIWTEIDLETDKDLRSVTFADNLHGWITLKVPFGVYSTTDGGNNWVYYEHSLLSMFFIDAINGWAGAYDSIQRSYDGGLTWVNQHIINGIWLHDIRFSDFSHGYYSTNSMGGDGHSYRTIDGGNSWIEVDGLDYGFINCIGTLDDSSVWFAGPGIYFSNDQCNTLVHFQTPVEVNAISIHGLSNGWAVGGYEDGNEGYIWKLEGSNNWIPAETLGVINNRIRHGISLDIYPNPVTNTLNLNYESDIIIGEIRIYNLIGQTIFHQQKIDQIDVSVFPTGIYILEARLEDGVVREKFVKE